MYNIVIIYILIGVVLSTSSTALIGSFWYLQKKSLIGDTIAHAILPGICISFLYNSTNLPFYLTIGAYIAGYFSLWLLEQINQHSKIKKDSAIALIISIFLGIGLFLLHYIQQHHGVNTNLKGFLLGHASTLVTKDILLSIQMASIVICTIILLFKAFTTISFDPTYAYIIGWPTRLLNFLIQSLTVLTLTISIQSIGTLLAASILVLPAATAHLWTNRLTPILLLATFFSTLASTLGISLSWAFTDLPTGPSIILCMCTIAFLSLLISPKKGILPKKYKHYKYQEKIANENLLKLFYELGNKNNTYYKDRTLKTLEDCHSTNKKKLLKVLYKLEGKKLVVQKGPTSWTLTQQGKKQGKHIVDLHRLWETYLLQYLKILPDHVHDDAEFIEHLLSPEIESELRKTIKDATI